MINNMIQEGKIVTIKLLQRAMENSGSDKFLVDGFPRNEENRAPFESITYYFLQTGIELELVLFFDYSEQEMEKQLLNRNQGFIS
ncbi:ump-cmp kinase 3 [Phtheirospermum japonicum]|uniref:adenylate kinase n=1 Tax=Phtheirospermum japonicum TaxID=374723 RepID=A0A830B874_9LAMI|nr:ump-cmp kinase 3 [Phtheirospermum japonicum]